MRPRQPDKVKLVVSLFTGERSLFGEALEKLQNRFGRIDFLSELLDFSSTDYYAQEFGGGLKRRVASFEPLMELEDLPAVKAITNGLEAEYLKGGRRLINIDPGYIALEKFVLASCKNFSHRIYIGGGVHADLTMIYRGRAFASLPWTYPDYDEAGMKSILKQIRRRYALHLGKGLKNG